MRRCGPVGAALSSSLANRNRTAGNLTRVVARSNDETRTPKPVTQDRYPLVVNPLFMRQNPRKLIVLRGPKYMPVGKWGVSFSRRPPRRAPGGSGIELIQEVL